MVNGKSQEDNRKDQSRISKYSLYRSGIFAWMVRLY